MTRRNAQGVRRHLTDVKIVLEDCRGPKDVLGTVDLAIHQIDTLLTKEVCPSCKHLLRDWYDHAENCATS